MLNLSLKKNLGAQKAWEIIRPYLATDLIPQELKKVWAEKKLAGFLYKQRVSEKQLYEIIQTIWKSKWRNPSSSFKNIDDQLQKTFDLLRKETSPGLQRREKFKKDLLVSKTLQNLIEKKKKINIKKSRRETMRQERITKFLQSQSQNDNSPPISISEIIKAKNKQAPAAIALPKTKINLAV